ncbi:MAG TPA: hypothetical protein PKZ16_00725 [bacterium]|nr:hypothetical protein [bacterium]HPL95410.1 hypothetical protein [bacterium]
MQIENKGKITKFSSRNLFFKKIELFYFFLISPACQVPEGEANGGQVIS